MIQFNSNFHHRMLVPFQIHRFKGHSDIKRVMDMFNFSLEKRIRINIYHLRSYKIDNYQYHHLKTIL